MKVMLAMIVNEAMWKVMTPEQMQAFAGRVTAHNEELQK